MANVLHPDLVKYVNVGDPLRAGYLNSFTRGIKQSLQQTKGFHSPDFFVQNEREFGFEDLLGSTSEEIPKYSIFSIDTNSKDFSLKEPRVTYKKFETGDKFLVTNEDKVFVGNNLVYYRSTLIGRHKKYIFRYDPADGVPVLADTLGPVDGTYTLSKAGIGFIALSNPDPERNLIWASSVGQGGSNLNMGKLNSNLSPDNVGDLTIWDQVGTTTPEIVYSSTGKVIQVLNATKITLRTNVMMKVFYPELWAMPIAFPHEIQECFQPSLLVQTNGLDATSTVTINEKSRLLFDPGATGSPRTIQFPESTLLPEGSEVGFEVVNSNTTTVTLASNPASSSDKLMNPLNRSAAPASSFSGLNLALKSEKFILIKTGQVNPLWYNEGD